MIFIALSYLAVASLLGLAVLLPKRLVASLVLCAVTPLMALAVWLALAERAGWAHPGLPPRHSEVLYGGAREPDPQTGDRGKIFLLVLPPNSSQPRLFAIPYSRRIQKQLYRMKKQGTAYAVGYGSSPKSKHRLYLEPPASPPAKSHP